MTYTWWTKKNLLSAALAVLAGFLLVGGLARLPARAGKIDFRAYWSASYLLSQRENFTSDDQLMEVQQEHTGWNTDYAMKTWNPPWVLVWLLPYASLEFDHAANVWLFTNIFALFFSVVSGWRIYAAQSPQQRWIWLPLLAAVLFPSTIVAMIYGQVNLAVLGSLLAFLTLYHRSHDFAAGLALSITTLKPHLLYLTLLIIVLDALHKRRWGVFAGLLTSLGVSTLVVFLLRPSFMAEYLASNTSNNLLAWETATLATYLSIQLGWAWVRLIGIALLPVIVVWWIRNKDRLAFMTLVNVTLLLSIMTMPFGWSYDFVVLLLPIMNILLWIVASRSGLQRFDRLLAATLLIGMYLVSYYQRIQTPSELFFFWVPVVIAGIYFWLYWRSHNSLSGSIGHKA